MAWVKRTPAGAVRLLTGEPAGKTEPQSVVVSCHIGVVRSSSGRPLALICAREPVRSKSKWSLGPPKLTVGLQKAAIAASLQPARTSSTACWLAQTWQSVGCVPPTRLPPQVAAATALQLLLGVVEVVAVAESRRPSRSAVARHIS